MLCSVKEHLVCWWGSSQSEWRQRVSTGAPRWCFLKMHSVNKLMRSFLAQKKVSLKSFMSLYQFFQNRILSLQLDGCLISQVRSEVSTVCMCTNGIHRLSFMSASITFCLLSLQGRGQVKTWQSFNKHGKQAHPAQMLRETLKPVSYRCSNSLQRVLRALYLSEKIHTFQLP